MRVHRTMVKHKQRSVYISTGTLLKRTFCTRCTRLPFKTMSLLGFSWKRYFILYFVVLMLIVIFTAFTTTKKAELEQTLASWNVDFELEILPAATQRNASDCGLHVISFIHSAIKTNGENFNQVLLERETLLRLSCESVPTVRPDSNARSSCYPWN